MFCLYNDQHAGEEWLMRARKHRLAHGNGGRKDDASSLPGALFYASTSEVKGCETQLLHHFLAVDHYY